MLTIRSRDEQRSPEATESVSPRYESLAISIPASREAASGGNRWLHRETRFSGNTYGITLRRIDAGKNSHIKVIVPFHPLASG